MPIYTYCCEKCGKRFETFKKVADLDRPEISPCCLGFSQRVITATLAIRPAFDSYISPASGRIVRNASERRDDLARTNCIEYDPEMRKDVQRRREESERNLDQMVEETVCEALAQLPT